MSELLPWPCIRTLCLLELLAPTFGGGRGKGRSQYASVSFDGLQAHHEFLIGRLRQNPALGRAALTDLLKEIAGLSVEVVLCKVDPTL